MAIPFIYSYTNMDISTTLTKAVQNILLNTQIYHFAFCEKDNVCTVLDIIYRWAYVIQKIFYDNFFFISINMPSYLDEVIPQYRIHQQ